MTLDMDTNDVYRLSLHLPARAGAILLAEVEARRKRGLNQKNGAGRHTVVADALVRAFGKKHTKADGG